MFLTCLNLTLNKSSNLVASPGTSQWWLWSRTPNKCPHTGNSVFKRQRKTRIITMMRSIPPKINIFLAKPSTKNKPSTDLTLGWSCRLGLLFILAIRLGERRPGAHDSTIATWIGITLPKFDPSLPPSQPRLYWPNLSIKFNQPIRSGQMFIIPKPESCGHFPIKNTLLVEVGWPWLRSL